MENAIPQEAPIVLGSSLLGEQDSKIMVSMARNFVPETVGRAETGYLYTQDEDAAGSQTVRAVGGMQRRGAKRRGRAKRASRFARSHRIRHAHALCVQCSHTDTHRGSPLPP